MKHIYELKDSDHHFCFFRNGVEPNWDDPVHRDGGRFVVILRGNNDMRDAGRSVLPKPKRGMKKFLEDAKAAEEDASSGDVAAADVSGGGGGGGAEAAAGGDESTLDVEEAWIRAILGVVGGDFDFDGGDASSADASSADASSASQPQLVTGAMIERKHDKKRGVPEYRLSVWLRDGMTDDTATAIGRRISSTLGLPARMLELYRFNKKYFKQNPVVIV